MSAFTPDDTQPIDADAIRRTIAKLRADRVAAYEAHVLPIDAALTAALCQYNEDGRHACEACGAEDTPSGCVNAACERFNGARF